MVKKKIFYCLIPIIVVMLCFLIDVQAKGFSGDSERWLISHSQDILNEGLQELSEDAVSLYTSNEEIMNKFNQCIEAVENTDILEIVCMYTKDNMIRILKLMGQENDLLADSIVEDSLDNYLNSKSVVDIATNVIIWKLWTPYCIPEKALKDMPSQVAVFFLL